MPSFIRAAAPTYFAPASLQQLDAEGRLVNVLFDCQFKRLKASELQRLQQDVQAWTTAEIEKMRQQIEAASKAASNSGTKDGSAEGSSAEPAKEATVDETVNRRTLERVMVGWRAVEAADGGALPFSMEAVDSTEEEAPGFIAACANAFWKSCQPSQAAHLAAKN